MGAAPWGRPFLEVKPGWSGDRAGFQRASGLSEIHAHSSLMPLGMLFREDSAMTRTTWTEFAADSTLEGGGFEPSVPRREGVGPFGGMGTAAAARAQPGQSAFRSRERSYEAFAAVAVRMSALRLSAEIRPSMPWLLRIAANSERRVATSLIAPSR
jgi:hypothetical protein